MEQEISFQFARLATAIVVTSVVASVLVVLLLVRYRQLIGKWKAIGFTFGPVRTLLMRIMPPVMIVLLIGTAFAEPFLVNEETVFERNDVEVCYLFDNAGSMAASPASDEPARIDRALAIAESLSRSDAMFGVKTCVATFTSEPTLNLPATSHVPTVVSVLQDVITVGDPPPETKCISGQTCTNLSALEGVSERFFSNKDPGTKRVLIVFTDGETAPFNASAMRQNIEKAGVEIIFVDLWSSDEEIFDTTNCVDTLAGCIDNRYKSDLVGREAFLSFVQSSESGYVRESDSGSLVDLVANVIGESDSSADNSPISASERRQPYAWFFVLLAGLVAAVTYSDHFMGIFAVFHRDKNRKDR